MAGGKDSYGQFKTHVTPNPFTCHNCSQPCTVMIQYWPRAVQLPQGIKPEDTILGKNKSIGVTCGCYAKGHRQIARIDERMKSRG